MKEKKINHGSAIENVYPVIIQTLNTVPRIIIQVYWENVWTGRLLCKGGGGKRELIFHRGELIDNIYNEKIKQEYIHVF